MTSITQAANPAEPYVASSAPARIAPRVIDGMCRIPRLDLRHGGNREAVASRLNCAPSQLLDASASLVPWSPRFPRIGLRAWRD